MTGAEQSEGDLDIGSRDPAGLGNGPHGVIQPRPRIPDRVPDPVRDRGDALTPGVQQENVEVAAGQQFAPTVPAHRDQGHTGLGPEHASEPPIRFGSPASTVRSERRHQSHKVSPDGSSDLDRVGTAFSRTDSDDRVDGHRPHLSVADPTGLRGLQDDADEIVGVLIVT